MPQNRCWRTAELGELEQVPDSSSRLRIVTPYSTYIMPIPRVHPATLVCAESLTIMDLKSSLKNYIGAGNVR